MTFVQLNKKNTRELVLYLSDGEFPKVMPFVELAENLHKSLEGCCDHHMMAGFGSVNELISDIAGATDWEFAQGFWHGVIDNYNVAVVDLTMALQMMKESQYDYG